MQTRRPTAGMPRPSAPVEPSPPTGEPSRGRRPAPLSLARLAAVLATVIVVILPASCGVPRISGALEAERRISRCDAEDVAAVTVSTRMTGKEPLSLRFLAAREASSLWSSVATGCPARFAEGVMHTVQALRVESSLADALGQDGPSMPSVDTAAVSALDIDHQALATMAVAEDRAGFVIGLLAARNVTGATLALSDFHRALGQRLASAATGADDRRREFYDVSTLLSHPTVVSDSSTGLEVPTAALAEIDCARGIASEVTAATSGVTRAGVLSTLSSLVATPLVRGLDLGYPSLDSALLS
ncbi:hypothetical protein [uncultured Bifidobacterium sp.]|uniref:hypothetical protein n=1 Tax=uncultured Bifidobacterium sp. TaxID=165187 RepID=UPI0028DD3DAF|nr:hypothetical protein [uncultured Bifidobacterium sp.]